METLHEVRDTAKVRDLEARIERDGWQGSPLVVDGEQLLTGTHRYAACKALGMPDYEIPTIDIRDLFADAGMDFHASWSAAEDIYADWCQAMVYVLDQLPPVIRDTYGIDLH